MIFNTDLVYFLLNGRHVAVLYSPEQSVSHSFRISIRLLRNTLRKTLQYYMRCESDSNTRRITV